MIPGLQPWGVGQVAPTPATASLCACTFVRLRECLQVSELCVCVCVCARERECVPAVRSLCRCARVYAYVRVDTLALRVRVPRTTCMHLSRRSIFFGSHTRRSTNERVPCVCV